MSSNLKWKQVILSSNLIPVVDLRLIFLFFNFEIFKEYVNYFIDFIWNYNLKFIESKKKYRNYSVKKFIELMLLKLNKILTRKILMYSFVLILKDLCYFSIDKLISLSLF